MVEFITGASGTGKTMELLERIKECSGKERIVLVPEQYSTEFDKKLYYHIGAKDFNSLLSLSFSSLARQLFQIYGEPDRKGEYADDMARLILTYQAINEAKNNPEQLLFFRRGGSQPGFAEEILKLIGDMKKSGISPQKLMLKADLFEKRLHDKVKDTANIFYEYEFLMEQYGFKDHLENIREAAKAANLNGFFKGTSVFLDEFESFTGDQLDMLKIIFSAAENIVIALRTDDVNAGEFTLFETVNNTYRCLSAICRELNIPVKVTRLEKSRRFVSPELEYLSERAMRNLPNDTDNAPESKNIRIFEARDMYSEAEYVCAELVRLIHSDETLKFRDIAVISNKIEDYADVLKAAFARYDIPYFLSIEQPVAHTSVMVFFLSLLDLLTAKKLKSEQIFRLLKCGLLEAELTDVSLLENYCYKWGIDGNMWTEPFTANDDNLEQLEAMRESIAIAFYLFALDALICKNSLKHYYLRVWPAIFAHTFGFVTLFFPLIRYLKINKYLPVIFALFLVVLFSISDLVNTLVEGMSIMENAASAKATKYIESDIYGESTLSIAGIIALILSRMVPIAYITFVLYRNKDPKTDVFIPYLLCYMFVILLRMEMPIFFRFYNYFEVMMIIGMTQAVSVRTKVGGYNVTALTWIMILFMIIIRSYELTKPETASIHDYKTYNRYIPYNSIFTEDYNEESEYIFRSK